MAASMVALWLLALAPAWAPQDVPPEPAGPPAVEEPDAELVADEGAEEIEEEPVEAHGLSSWDSLDLGYAGWGLSFGNSARWTGLRINVRDEAVESVRGLNITFWKPPDNAAERVDGMALGLYGPRADSLRGLSLGLLTTSGRQTLKGVHVAGLVNHSGGEMSGIGLALLANVAQGQRDGLHLAGLANVTQGPAGGVAVAGLSNVGEGDVTGLLLGGLANVVQGSFDGLALAGMASVVDGDVSGLLVGGMAAVSDGSMTGVQMGGLATVSQGDMSGLHLAGLAVVSDGHVEGVQAAGFATVGKSLTGINLGGLAVTASESIEGINVGGLAVRAGHLDEFEFVLFDEEEDEESEPLPSSNTRIDGLSAALWKVQAAEIRGVALAGLYTHSERMYGFTLGAFNDVAEHQTGLSVGLLNLAEDLDGVQIGLLNHVATNPTWAQWLPLVNARF